MHTSSVKITNHLYIVTVSIMVLGIWYNANVVSNGIIKNVLIINQSKPNSNISVIIVLISMILKKKLLMKLKAPKSKTTNLNSNLQNFILMIISGL